MLSGLIGVLVACFFVIFAIHDDVERCNVGHMLVLVYKAYEEGPRANKNSDRRVKRLSLSCLSIYISAGGD